MNSWRKTDALVRGHEVTFQTIYNGDPIPEREAAEILQAAVDEFRNRFGSDYSMQVRVSCSVGRSDVLTHLSSRYVALTSGDPTIPVDMYENEVLIRNITVFVHINPGNGIASNGPANTNTQTPANTQTRPAQKPKYKPAKKSRPAQKQPRTLRFPATDHRGRPFVGIRKKGSGYVPTYK